VLKLSAFDRIRGMGKAGKALKQVLELIYKGNLKELKPLPLLAFKL
jgi:hypothetical protein